MSATCRTIFLSCLTLLGTSSPGWGQRTELVVPRGLELIEGNALTSWPFDTSVGQKWHWVVDSSQLGGTAVRIDSLAVRPDASVTRWDAAVLENVEVVLASATRDYLPATWDPNFDPNLDPGDRRVVFAGRLDVPAGAFAGPGPAPWVLEIPFATPFVYDPTRGRDLVIQIRTPGGASGNPFLFPIDGQSGNAAFVRGNRYGHPSDPNAARWTFANDAFLPAIRLMVDEAAYLRPAFGAQPRAGLAPLTVAFQDLSTSSAPITSWAWDFDGDGTIDSTQRAPTHVYTAAGAYTVRLTIGDGTGTATHTEPRYVVVDPPPVADFDALPRRGPPPLAVAFQDRSTNRPTSWAWDFDNDGTIDSTQPAPTHVYAVPGIYDVTLTVANPSGSDTRTRSGWIRVESSTTTPFEDDFEAPVLQPAWVPNAVNPAEIALTGPVGGVRPARGAAMVVLAGDGVRHGVRALDLHVDWTGVAAATDVELTFLAYDHDDDPDPEDGLFLSVDGTTFHRVLAWRQRLVPTRTWLPVAIDLDDELARRNLVPAADVILRFQQAGRETFANDDGLALDALRIGRTRLEARFDAAPRGGAVPLVVQFGDRSLVPNGRSIVAWEWDFDGDGTVDSRQPHPTATYSLAGVHDVTLTIRDDLGNAATRREPRFVRAVTPAPFPFEDDFELGTLAACWEVREGPGGRIAATSALGGPASQGLHHVLLDRGVGAGDTTNDLILHVDLSTATTAQLVYDLRETGDENHPEDGVFVSDDGMRWVLARSHQDGPQTSTRQRVDLGALARSAGLTLGRAFRIRFSQRDDLATPADGVLIDRVRVEPLDGTWRAFGAGCDGGSGRVPLLLTTGGLPNVGNPFFAILLRDAPPSSSARLAVGLSEATWAGFSLPLDLTAFGAPGCTLFISVDMALDAPTDALGTARLAVPLPFDPALIGLAVYAQWSAVDPGSARPLPLVLSAATAIAIGGA